VAKRRDRWYRFVLWIARHIVLRFFSGGLKVYGEENVPKDGPVILAPIHVSFFDPPVVSCASPRVVSFMAKDYLFKPPVFGPLIRSLNAFPVKSGNETAAVRTALEVLANGGTLIVFPEGTRGDGKVLGAMQSGVAMLAKRSGAQVVPVGVYGSHRILPRGRKFPGFSPLRASFGEPFTYAEAAGDDSREGRQRFLDRLAGAIAEQCRKVGLDVRIAPGP